MSAQTDDSGEPGLRIDDEFVAEHGPWMLKLAASILEDEALAQDAVQDALLAAHQAAADFAGRSAVRTWLYRITVNCTLAIRRKRGADALPADTDALQPAFDANACRIEREWSGLTTPDEVLEDAERTLFVRRCVESLPEDYRICLQLRDFAELSVREIAGILDISESNVKVRTHRARSALKRLLEPLLRGESLDDALADLSAPAQSPGLKRIVKGLMTNYLPLMITCQQFEDFIIDYLEGELPNWQRALFEFHIKTCRECRDYLAAYRRARSIARAANALVASVGDIPNDLLRAVTLAQAGADGAPP